MLAKKTDPKHTKVLELLADRWWRLCNLYYIQDETGSTVKFTPNEAQRELWEEIHSCNAILKARQLGFSTFVAIFILDTCLFREGTSAGIIDVTLDDAKKKLGKIKFAYHRLPDEIKGAIGIKTDNALELIWNNGSSVMVGTSHRGGTLQILHVSEYGKIAARFPDKSREIKTGAFGTIHKGSITFVESTAEGAAGDYYDLVTEAKNLKTLGKKLSHQDFKLHFFPWWRHKGYVDDPTRVLIPADMIGYFRDLTAKHGIECTPEQQAWYVAKRKQIGPDDMFREYPSYPDEAFNASVLGAYFAVQMTKAREQRRITAVPLDPSRPVNTFWDIGKSDDTAIWFHQNHGRMHHFIDFYANSGEGVDHYAKFLKDKADERKFNYGVHYGPHDLDNSHWVLPGSKAVVDVARELGIRFKVVPRISHKASAIEAARNMLGMSWFDEVHCKAGLDCLDNYQRRWDERRGAFSSEELSPHWANHGADAYMTGACGFQVAMAPDANRPRPKVGHVA
jgi:hypothetical protein